MLFTQILHVGPPKEPQKSQNRTTANETLKLYAIIHHFKYIQRKVGMPSQPSFPAFYLLTSEDPKLSFFSFFFYGSYFAVDGMEEIFRVAHLGLLGANCRRYTTDISYRAQFQCVWFLCCTLWLSCHFN